MTARISDRHRRVAIWGVGGLLPLLALLGVGVRLSPFGREDAAADRGASAGTGANERREAQDEAIERSRYPVVIRRPDGPPVIELAESDTMGRTARVGCMTCHSTRPANLNNRSPRDLDEFHQGMRFSHGSTVCYSCHNPTDANSLRLADGTAVQYSDVMRLCAQCHGPQARDYARYSHGGFNGYWDLSRGGRIRANCVDCHDPHVPRFPKMVPTFKPNDRFLKHHSEHGSSRVERMEGEGHE